MKKYIHAGLRMMNGFFKAVLLKLTCGKSFNGKLVCLISPRTEITLDRGGQLFWGQMLKVRSGCKVRVRKNAKLAVGDNFSMSNNGVITARESIRIGSNVQFGPGVLVYDHDHDYKAHGGLAAKKYKTSPIEIGDNVWIGANSIILRGTKIGSNCVVAAGTIVRGEIPDGSLVYQKRDTQIKVIDME